MNSPLQWLIEPTRRAIEPGEVLARLPRLLRFRLVGREDRLLLRLAARLGFEGGASLEISAEEPSGVQIRALDGVDEERWRRQLELELVSLRDLARRPVARRLSAALEPAAARLQQGLRHDRLTVLPLGAREGGWRLLLLAGGGEHAAEILAALRDAARTVLDEGRRQRDLRVAEGGPPNDAATNRGFRDRERARRMIERQDGMLVGLAHDLKNPLAAAGTALAVLSSGRAGELTDQQGEMVELAARSARRLERMIDRILEAAREEEKELVLDRRVLNTRALFERILDAPAATAHDQGKHFAWIADTGMEIYGDADGIHRIVENLLGNALKFTTAGAHILVTARKRCILPENESLGRVAGMLGRCVDGVEILVEDDGPGLSEEARARAFERFWQGSGERERRRGAGLGLSIVHSMVTAHQGWIRLEGEPGEGTRVRLWLPSNEKDAALLLSLRSMEDELERQRRRGHELRLLWLESRDRRPAATQGFERAIEDIRLASPGEIKLAQPHPSSALVVGTPTLERIGEWLEGCEHEVRGEARFPQDGEDLESLLENVIGKKTNRAAAAVASGAPDLEVSR